MKEVDIERKNGHILAFPENGPIVTPKSLCDLSFDDLLCNVNAVLDANEAANKNSHCDKIDRRDFVVITFFQYLDQFNECVSRNSFTDAFEVAFKLKLFLHGRSDISVFVGDADLGLAMSGVCFKITSSLFDLMEGLEKQGQLTLSTAIEPLKLTA